MTTVFCTGSISYDERVALPYGVYSTLERAMASVKLREGEEWEHDARAKEWTVQRSGAADHDDIIGEFKIDAEDEIDAEDDD
jgi:hypothetical protein